MINHLAYLGIGIVIIALLLVLGIALNRKQEKDILERL